MVAPRNLNQDTLPNRILLRQQQYEQRQERVQYEEVLREIIAYCRPDLQTYLGKDGEAYQGEKRGTTMYTSKIATDIDQASDAFAGHLLNPGDWFRYRVQIPWLNDNNQVQKWLQEREEQFNGIFASSNFYTVLPGGIADAMTLGNHFVRTGYMRAKPKINFRHLPVLACWWSVDEDGNLTAFHQKVLYDALEAYRIWGDKCSASLIRSLKDGNPLTKYEFIESIYQSDDPTIGEHRLQWKNRPWVSFWVQVDSEKNAVPGDVGILEEEPYTRCPITWWPYRRSGDETMGRGALHVSSVKRLNHMHKTMMLVADRAAQQPLKASTELQGRIELGPDGITYLENSDEQISPLYGSGQMGYPFGIEYLQRMEQEVERVLNLPMFLQMQQMTKEATAYEVWQRMAELTVVVGPRLAPLEKFYLSELHERLWQIEADANRIPPPPDILIAAARHPAYRHLAGDIVQAEFMGPLRQMQQLFLYMRRMIGLWGSIQPLLAADPRAVRKINAVRSVERILDAGGWPQDCIVPDEVLDAQDQQAAALQQAQMAGEMVERESKAVKNLSKPIAEDSAMAQLMGMGK